MKQNQKEHWENLLDRATRELSRYEKLHKNLNAEIKTMIDSGEFNVARIKEKKDFVIYYEEYIENFEKDINAINRQLHLLNEPKKIGRPSIGKARPVKINLPEEDWEKIDHAIQSGEYKSFAEYFRNLHEERERV